MKKKYPFLVIIFLLSLIPAYCIDLCGYFPLDYSHVWKYRAISKQNNKEVIVRGKVINKRDIDDVEYSFFNIPGLNINYFIRCDEGKLYMRMLRYTIPVLSLISVDAYLNPEVLTADFSKKEGEYWSINSMAKGSILFLSVEVPFSAKVRVIERSEIVFKDEKYDSMTFELTRDEGNGKSVVETHKYAEGLGYIGGETDEYRFILEEVEKYEPKLRK